MIAWILLFSVPVSIVLLIIWDAINFERQRSQEDPIVRASRVTALATIAIFLATAASVGVAALQWTALREANSDGQKAFIATQRAYMYFAGINTRKTQAPDSVRTFWIAPTTGNSGNTPTVGLLSRANCWTDEKEEPEPFDHFRSLKDKWIDGFYGPRAVLQATDCSMSVDEAKAVMNGRLHYYLAGEAVYKDSVTNPSPDHVTQFALEFTINQLDEVGGGFSGAVAQRGKHNCADDGVPKIRIQTTRGSMTFREPKRSTPLSNFMRRSGMLDRRTTPTWKAWKKLPYSLMAPVSQHMRLNKSARTNGQAKLGDSYDIEHKRDAVAGGIYGRIVERVSRDLSPARGSQSGVAEKNGD